MVEVYIGSSSTGSGAVILVWCSKPGSLLESQGKM
jgi:hypothetical protein